MKKFEEMQRSTKDKQKEILILNKPAAARHKFKTKNPI